MPLHDGPFRTLVTSLSGADFRPFTMWPPVTIVPLHRHDQIALGLLIVRKCRPAFRLALARSKACRKARRPRPRRAPRPPPRRLRLRRAPRLPRRRASRRARCAAMNDADREILVADVDDLDLSDRRPAAR